MRRRAGKRCAMVVFRVFVVKSVLNASVSVTDSQRGSFVNVGAFSALGGVENVSFSSESSQPETFARRPRTCSITRVYLNWR